MKVYLLERGCYDQAYVVGVFATPEAAMAVHAPERPKDHRGVHGREYGEFAGKPWSYEWHEDETGWSFGADWDDAADITEYEVRSAGESG